MFSLDKILLEFVGANWMSLYVLITLLKGVALMTKGTKDDKIVTLLSNMFKTLRGGKVPNEIPKVDAAKNPVKEVPQTSDTIR
jgi:hypothetical protein